MNREKKRSNGIEATNLGEGQALGAIVDGRIVAQVVLRNP